MHNWNRELGEVPLTYWVNAFVCTVEGIVASASFEKDLINSKSIRLRNGSVSFS